MLFGFTDDPNRKYSSGVDLGEEVIFEPQDENAPLNPEPSAGEPGFAPMQRVGGNLGGDRTPQPAAWEKNWSHIPTAEEAQAFLAQAGLSESFDAWKQRQK